MSITIVLPSNQELWKLKPNRETINIATENNDAIGKIVGLTSEKELREYLGNGTRITRTKCMYMHMVTLTSTTSSRSYMDVQENKQDISSKTSVNLARFQTILRGRFRSGINPRPEDPSSNHEIQWGKHQFPGERQQPTPVANFLNVRKIMCLFPGEIGQAIRSRMANVAVRADVGDEDLENVIPNCVCLRALFVIYNQIHFYHYVKYYDYCDILAKKKGKNPNSY